MAKLFVCALVVFLAAPSAHAQITVDVAKITCEQFFTLKVDPDAIPVWLSGFYHGKRNDTVLETQEFKENVNKLRVACRIPENFKLPIMQIIEKSTANGK